LFYPFKMRDMETGKFKLILYWLINVFGFYLLWLLSYFFSARQALSEINDVLSFKEGFWQQLSGSKVFAYFIYGSLITLLSYAFYWLAIKSPLPKVAAIIYIILVVSTTGVIITALLDKTDFWHLLPHWSLNIVFLSPLVVLLWSRYQEN